MAAIADTRPAHFERFLHGALIAIAIGGLTVGVAASIAKAPAFAGVFWTAAT
jgi:hypothetical protein